MEEPHIKAHLHWACLTLSVTSFSLEFLWKSDSQPFWFEGSSYVLKFIEDPKSFCLCRSIATSYISNESIEWNIEWNI